MVLALPYYFARFFAFFLGKGLFFGVSFSHRSAISGWVAYIHLRWACDLNGISGASCGGLLLQRSYCGS
jgi:hypothetical protein